MWAITRVAALAAAVVGGDLFLGGWGTITIENPPQAVQAGGTYRLEFTVRQHGMDPMRGLKPVVRAGVKGEGRHDYQATPTGKPGRYTALVQIPAGDSLNLQVDAGWLKVRLALLPVPIIERGGKAPVMTAAQWGRHLFVAKGCGTCHANDDIPEFGARNESLAFAPDLTGRTLEAAYVRQRLVDPASFTVTDRTKRMPDLGLNPSEVDALVALFSGPIKAALR